MVNYTKGAKFENDVVKFLTKKGMYCIRSAGSKGIVDVLAMKRLDGDTFVYLIQCKYGSASMSKKDKQKLIDLANKLKFYPLYIYRKKYSKEMKLEFL